MPESQPFKLIIEDDEGRRSVVPIELGDITLGRHENNAIRLKERNVSRRHARLVAQDDGHIAVYDLDSYNGLWANGERIEGRFELHQGDVLRIGDFQLELKGDALKPRREEATQRTQVREVQGTPSAALTQVPPEVTEVEVLEPTAPTHAASVAAKRTVPQVCVPSSGSPLAAIMNEATALIHPSGLEPEPTQSSTAFAAPFAKLLCLSTTHAGQEFTIQRAETVVGRTEDNDIAIDHRSISRHHAKIVVHAGRFRVVDLDSANGTLVNGEVYAQADLKRGDMIELGHVRLRFVPPGEAAEWTAEEQVLLRRIEARRQNRYPFLRNTPVVGLLLAGCAILGLGIACYLVYGPHHLRPSVTTGNANNRPALATTDGPVAASEQEEVERLLLQARHAVGGHQWKRAENLATAVIGLEPSRDEAQAILRQCAVEAKSQAAFETAVSANVTKHWSEAYNALQDVSHDSSVARSANTLMGQVKPALLEVRLADCANALHQEDWDEAELLVEEISGLDAARPELAELRNAIKDGRLKHPSSHPTRPSRSRKETTRMPPTRPGPTSGASVAPAVPSAPASLPGGSATALATTSRPPPARDPKAMYAEGTRLLASKQFSRAIDEFQHCIAADKNFAMCYRALGIAYADSNNGPEAVRYYRLYLKVDPNARDASQVRQLLQQYDASQPQSGGDGP